MFSEIITFRCWTGSLIFLFAFIISFQSVCCEKSETFTNAASGTSASELHPHQMNSPSYWIGSHTLEFTPNPFLKHRKSRSDSEMSESSEQSTAKSPISTTTQTPTTRTTPKQKRKGRKVKGRRRLRKPKTNLTISQAITRVNNNSQSPITDVNTNLVNKSLFNENVQLFPIDQVSIDPTFRFKLNSRNLQGRAIGDTGTGSEIIEITTSKPIRFDLDPKNNQIPVDFATIPPEKLNPSYFRNIILKAMMDRLVEVGVATHVPKTLIRIKS